MIERDKQLHFLWSFFLLAVFDQFIPLWVAFLIVLSIGISKEFVDVKFDWYDLLFDILGLLFYVGLIYIRNRFM